MSSGTPCATKKRDGAAVVAGGGIDIAPANVAAPPCPKCLHRGFLCGKGGGVAGIPARAAGAVAQRALGSGEDAMQVGRMLFHEPRDALNRRDVDANAQNHSIHRITRSSRRRLGPLLFADAA